MKKILTIIIIILIIVAVGFGAYWFFDKQETGGEGSFNISDYFPFGRGPESPVPEPTGGNNTPNTGGVPEPGSGTSEVTLTPRIWQISENPQSGAVIFQTKDASGTSTAVRYLDRATGNVFESKLSVLGRKRVSLTTIPKVHEALWLPGGGSLILRYLPDDSSDIKNLYAKIIPQTATTSEIGGEELQELQGTFLPGGLSGIAIEAGNTGNERIFYLGESQTGGMSGFISNPDGSKISVVFDSPVRGWLSSWPKKEIVALNTKPSAGVPGYLYFVDTKSGSFKKILGGIKGLTTLTKPDGKQVLYAESKSSGISLGIISTNSTQNFALPQKTLPEKCVWSTLKESVIYCAVPKFLLDAQYPDAWYQGALSFNDSIWRINASTSESEMIVDPRVAMDREVDAVNLALDKDEKFLIFTNKKDYQLWGVRLLEQ